MLANTSFAAGFQHNFTFRLLAPDPHPQFGLRSSPEEPSLRYMTTRKRSRSFAEMDGEGFEARQNKKRRLRLSFVTSRLSRPFSFPPTHIAGRQQHKLAAWSRLGCRRLCQYHLRKAAILNRIRRKKESQPPGFDLDTPPFSVDDQYRGRDYFTRAPSLQAYPLRSSIATSTSPLQRISSISTIALPDRPPVTDLLLEHVFAMPDNRGHDNLTPPPASPSRDLGVVEQQSNYDVFDDEQPFDTDGGSVYSDFRSLYVTSDQPPLMDQMTIADMGLNIGLADGIPNSDVARQPWSI